MGRYQWWTYPPISCISDIYNYMKIEHLLEESSWYFFKPHSSHKGHPSELWPLNKFWVLLRIIVPSHHQTRKGA